MGKLKIKKPKIQKNSIPAPLNVTNFTMEQISRQTGVKIESLKAYLNAREQEIKEQLIKESQEKLWKAEDYIAVANILISVIAIKKAWGFKKEMGLQIEFDSFDINKEFGFGESEVMPDAETVNN